MSGQKVTTDSLVKQLFKTANLKSFMTRNEKHLHCGLFHEYLQELCAARNIKPAQVIAKSGIYRTLGHQLFSGFRKPTRDKVIQLSLGFDMNFDEANELLKRAEMSVLYPRIKRDSVIIYALVHKSGLQKLQEVLYEMGLPLLSEKQQ